MEVTIIGCGGTGSYVVPNLIRLFQEKNISLSLDLVDGDTVSDRNIPRQNFCRSDIGRNKAEVLAERYAEGFGVSIMAYPFYLKEGNMDKIGLTLPICCVDNNKTRRLFDKYIYIDVGNEMEFGQVFFNYGTYRISDIHPEISVDKQESCTDNPTQSYMVNYMASMCVNMLVSDFIRCDFEKNCIDYFEILFDIYGKIAYRKKDKYNEIVNNIRELNKVKKVEPKVEFNLGDIVKIRNKSRVCGNNATCECHIGEIGRIRSLNYQGTNKIWVEGFNGRQNCSGFLEENLELVERPIQNSNIPF